MADTKEKAPAKDKGQKKGTPGQPAAPARGKEKGAAAAVDHAPKAREGMPRLQEYYEKTVRARLAKEFNLANRHQVPRIEKVVLNYRGVRGSPEVYVYAR